MTIFTFFIIIWIFFTTTALDSLNSLSDSLRIETDTTAVSKIDSTQIIQEGEGESLVYPFVHNRAYAIGEKLTFKIRYGIVRAGTAEMMVKKETSLNDKAVYHIQTTAKSTATFDWVYKVRDEINSYIDKEGLFSWKFEKKLREGGYKVDLLVNYSPEDSLADIYRTRYKRRKRNVSQSNYQVKTPPFVYDILAAFYYTRTQELQVGQTINLVNHDNRKIYNLEIKVYKKETIETAAGTFRCLQIEPLLKGEGIFKRKGRLRVWLSDDEYKIPVMMKSEVVVGHITTELEKFEGLPTSLPSMIIANE